MNLALGVIVLFLFLFLWARWQEKSSLFFPERDLYRSPAKEGMAYEDVHFDSGGHSLHGWYLPGPGKQAVLWMHGNAGNIADRLDQAMEMKRILGVSSFMFDYRGYGQSEGRPTEKGLYEDASAAFQWLLESKGFDPGHILLYGHSLGTPVAVNLALEEGSGAGGMVLESPLTRASDMAREIYYGLPVGLLMSVKLDTISPIGNLKMPVLVIHGDRDSVIPFKMGRRVFEAAPEPKAFLQVHGGDHSDGYIVGGDAYWSAWKDLMDQILDPKSKIQN